MKHNKKVSKAILNDKATSELKTVINEIDKGVDEIELAKMVYDSTTEETKESLNIRIEFTGLSEGECKILDKKVLDKMVKLAHDEINRLIDIRLGIDKVEDEKKD